MADTTMKDGEVMETAHSLADRLVTGSDGLLATKVKHELLVAMIMKCQLDGRKRGLADLIEMHQGPTRPEWRELLKEYNPEGYQLIKSIETEGGPFDLEELSKFSKSLEWDLVFANLGAGRSNVTVTGGTNLHGRTFGKLPEPAKRFVI